MFIYKIFNCEYDIFQMLSFGRESCSKTQFFYVTYLQLIDPEHSHYSFVSLSFSHTRPSVSQPSLRIPQTLYNTNKFCNHLMQLLVYHHQIELSYCIKCGKRYQEYLQDITTSWFRLILIFVQSFFPQYAYHNKIASISHKHTTKLKAKRIHSFKFQLNR